MTTLVMVLFQLLVITLLIDRVASVAKTAVVLFGPNSGLRIHDNPCLQYAQERSVSVIPVLVRSPDLPLKDRDAIERCLAKSISDLGGKLQTVDNLEQFDPSQIFEKSSSDTLEIIGACSKTLNQISTICSSKGNSVLVTAIPEHSLTASIDESSSSGIQSESLLFPEFSQRFYSNLASRVGKPIMAFDKLSFASPSSSVQVSMISVKQEPSSSIVSSESTALQLLRDYINMGDDAFSKKYAKDYIHIISGSSSLTQTSLTRLTSVGSGVVAGSDNAHELNTLGDPVALHRFFEGEVISGLLAPLLQLGCVSPRLLVHSRSYLQNSSLSFPFTDLIRNQLLACRLRDEVVRHDWHNRIAKVSVQQVAQSRTRDRPGQWEIEFSRWRGYLQRIGYMSTIYNGAHDLPKSNQRPLAVLVHGFGGSLDQFTALAKKLVQTTTGGSNNNSTSNSDTGSSDGDGDGSMDVLSLDSLGFGRSEKPPLSYNQYLWTDQVVDLLEKYAQGRDIILMGNSIGGFSAASAAARLANHASIRVKGLVLMNSAGKLLSPEQYAENPDDTPQFPPYTGPSPSFLRVFGKTLIAVLKLQIAPLCRWLYPSAPTVVEESGLAESIYRDSVDPGSYDVMAAGGKLPPPVSMNSLLHSYTGPVLICQGVLDPLNDANARADMFAAIRPGISVAKLELGHCPMDENATLVSESVKTWF